MKKIVCLGFVLVIVLTFIGCSASKSNNTEIDNTETTDRFIEVYSDLTNKILDVIGSKKSETYPVTT